MHIRVFVTFTVLFASVALAWSQSEIVGIQIPLSSGNSVTIDLKGDLVQLNLGASAVIHYDVGGRIDRVGDASIEYGAGGRIHSIGDSAIEYGAGGRILSIADAELHYDVGGRLSAVGDAAVGADVGGRIKAISSTIPHGLRISVALD